MIPIAIFILILVGIHIREKCTQNSEVSAEQPQESGAPQTEVE